MSDEKDITQKKQEQMARGDEARRVLESPLVKEFFPKIKEHVRAAWENSAPDDMGEREHQWRLFQAVGLVEACFTETIRTGDFARKELLKQQKEKEK